MSNREYSSKNRASEIFFDLLDSISRRGWYSAGPDSEENDVDSLMYVSFHIHPDDSDFVFRIINEAISKQKDVFWRIEKSHGNRFVLCSTIIAEEAISIGNLGKAARICVDENAELGVLTARELIALSDTIYEMYLLSR